MRRIPRSFQRKKKQETCQQKVARHRQMCMATFIYSTLRPGHLRASFASFIQPQESPPRFEAPVLLSSRFQYSRTRKNREKPFPETGHIKTLKRTKGQMGPSTQFLKQCICLHSIHDNSDFKIKYSFPHLTISTPHQKKKKLQ